MQGIRNLTTFLIDYARDTKTEANFPEEMRRKGKGGKGKSANTKSVPDAKCPLCGKAVQENTKAFGCAAWRDGCHFTLWKDCLARGGGPQLNAKLVALLLEKGSIRGSTGMIDLKDGKISFTPNGQENPSVSLGITYEKK